MAATQGNLLQVLEDHRQREGLRLEESLLAILGVLQDTLWQRGRPQ